MVVRDITFESGFIVVTKEGGGPPDKTAFADILRAVDIPKDLNIASLALLSRLGKITALMLEELIDKKILNEEFPHDYDLDWAIAIFNDELAIEDGYGA